MAGYDDVWQGVSSAGPGSANQQAPRPTTLTPVVPKRSVEELLDRKFRHVDHCAVCQKVRGQGLAFSSYLSYW